MKKMISLVSAFTMAASMSCVTSFADDSPVPVDIDPVAYDQLVDRFDENEDGIMTAEELYSKQYMSLSLDGVEDISWLANMTELIFISLDCGEITDLSVLGELSNLKNVFLYKVPITDIDFAKENDLDFLMLREMDQITAEQRLEVLRYGDIKLKKGFSTSVSITPIDMFYPATAKVYVDDTNIASFNDDISGTDELGAYRNGECAAVYGKECGETDYKIVLDDGTVFSGKITVEEADYADLPTAAEEDYSLQCFSSAYYGTDKAILDKDTLYGMQGDKLVLGEKNVKKFERMYYYEGSPQYVSCDAVLLENGCVKVNGKTVTVNSDEDVKFRDINYRYLLGENNRLYYLCLNENGYEAIPFGAGCERFLDDSSQYCVSTDGFLCMIDTYKEDDVTYYKSYKTSIEEPVGYYANYFIDKNNTLWGLNRRTNSFPAEFEIAQNVVEVGFMSYSDGMVASGCYVKADGTAYTLSSRKPVELYEAPSQSEEQIFKVSGRFMVDRGEIMSSQLTPSDYYISNDNVLTLKLYDDEAAIRDVAEYLFDTYEDGVLTAYFTRTDNTVWKYSLGENTCSQLMPEESEITVNGDANGDGIFSIADAVLVQKYLTSQEIAFINSSCDIDGDGDITVYDFVLIRKMLI